MTNEEMHKLDISLWQPIRKPLLTVFILAHLIGLTLWVSPNWPYRNLLLVPVTPYVNFFGLWQGWSVFAPNPKTWSTYLTAKIKFKDGSTKEWEFPRLEKMDYFQRMVNERFRKWALDSVDAGVAGGICPDAVRYVARLHNNKNNPPVSVSLIRHWQADLCAEDAEKPETALETGTYVLYTGKVQPGDLK